MWDHFTVLQRGNFILKQKRRKEGVTAVARNISGELLLFLYLFFVVLGARRLFKLFEVPALQPSSGLVFPQLHSPVLTNTNTHLVQSKLKLNWTVKVSIQSFTAVNHFFLVWLFAWTCFSHLIQRIWWSVFSCLASFNKEDYCDKNVLNMTRSGKMKSENELTTQLYCQNVCTVFNLLKILPEADFLKLCSL